jgi:hypothetical protein
MSKKELSRPNSKTLLKAVKQNNKEFFDFIKSAYQSIRLADKEGNTNDGERKLVCLIDSLVEDLKEIRLLNYYNLDNVNGNTEDKWDRIKDLLQMGFDSNLNFKIKKAFFKANKEKLAYWIELVINDKDFCIEKYEVLEFILSFSWEELESVPGLEKLILIIVEHILMFGASEYGDDFTKFVSSRGRKRELEKVICMFDYYPLFRKRYGYLLDTFIYKCESVGLFSQGEAKEQVLNTIRLTDYYKMVRRREELNGTK